MFQKYFYLIALLSVFNAFSQTISFKDINLKVALLAANSSNETAKDLTSNFAKIDTNNNGEIEESEALQVSYLYLQDLSLTSASGLEYFKNLTYLNINFNQINDLNVTSLVKLQELNCGGNTLGTLDLSKQTNLEALYCTYAQLTTLNLSGLSKLKSIDCSHNQLKVLDLKSATVLENLNCEYNELLTLDLDYNSLLKVIYVNNNMLSSLSLSGLNALTEANCGNNQLSTLSLGIIGNLQIFNCESNLLTALNLSKLTKLTSLICADNKLTTLDVSTLSNLSILNCEKNAIKQLYFTNSGTLQELNCGNNVLNALIVSGLVNVKKLDCNNNQLTTLDCSKLAKIEYLYVYNNLLTDINIQNLKTLKYLNCNTNQLTNINMTGLSAIETLYCSENKLTQLDVSPYLKLQSLICDTNKLTTINLKNGILKSSLDFSANPTLTYICVDDSEWDIIQNQLDQLQYTNCEVNSYCTFVPGGVYYTITGSTKYDSNKNGCDSSDATIANQKFTLSDISNSVDYISNKTGSFSFPVIAGSYILSPEFENGTYFDTAPATTAVTFPNTSNSFNQDQCVSKVSNFSDLEIVIFPTNAAVPSGLVSYKLIVKNNGNSTQSGTIKLLYDTKVVASIYSTNPTASKVLGEINWSFTNLAPFAYNRYTVTYKINATTSSNPVFENDILTQNATITTTPTDNYLLNNNFVLNHTVESAASTNVLTCLEGASISESKVGDYIHYVIRYKNTKTTSLKNLVIRNILDENVFDPSTLEWTEASENGVTKISKGNIVEFIYENINLPVGAEGYLAYKVKSLPTLKSGDAISNSAEIYLDLNKHIPTNVVTSTIQTLNNPTFNVSKSVAFFPNPAKETLYVKVEDNVMVKNYSIFSIIGQEIIKGDNIQEGIRVSDITTGQYILKLNTNQGTVTKMFVKE